MISLPTNAFIIGYVDNWSLSLYKVWWLEHWTQLEISTCIDMNVCRNLLIYKIIYVSRYGKRQYNPHACSILYGIYASKVNDNYVYSRCGFVKDWTEFGEFPVIKQISLCIHITYDVICELKVSLEGLSLTMFEGMCEQEVPVPRHSLKLKSMCKITHLP